jgi:16S rRNA C1402 (ribose-2'-O) methylase RsmI
MPAAAAMLQAASPTGNLEDITLRALEEADLTGCGEARQRRGLRVRCGVRAVGRWEGS